MKCKIAHTWVRIWAVGKTTDGGKDHGPRGESWICILFCFFLQINSHVYAYTRRSDRLYGRTNTRPDRAECATGCLPSGDSTVEIGYPILFLDRNRRSSAFLCFWKTWCATFLADRNRDTGTTAFPSSRSVCASVREVRGTHIRCILRSRRTCFRTGLARAAVCA